MSRNRAAKLPPMRRNADGQPLCRWCGEVVHPPRRSWCSQACVDAGLMQSNPSFARQQVRKRDHGVCAVCGMDCLAERAAMKRLVKISRQGIGSYVRWGKRIAKRYGVSLACVHAIAGRYRDYGDDDPPKNVAARILRLDFRLRRFAKARFIRLAAILTAKGFHGIRAGNSWLSAGESYWQADHIVPVVEGGGECGLENYRTLCQACHKAETKKLATRRAAKRREATEHEKLKTQPMLPL